MGTGVGERTGQEVLLGDTVGGSVDVSLLLDFNRRPWFGPRKCVERKKPSSCFCWREARFILKFEAEQDTVMGKTSATTRKSHRRTQNETC